MADSLLSLDGVSYHYEPGRPALRDVSVSVQQGERIGVLGNNGAGKSTFFLCCNGVLAPDQGSITLEGQRVTKNKKQMMNLRRSVGIVFQDPDDQMIGSTVEGEISFGPLNLGLDAAQTRDRVDQAVNQMDLEAYRQRPPHRLSGGEKKRVSIADVLAMRPRMLLFDEPTSSLDPENAVRLRGILDSLSRAGMALMVATHDVDFALDWADRVLVFSGGRLVADDTPDTVFQNRELLEQAGLRPPVIHETARAVCEANGCPLPSALPRNLDEFKRFIKEI